MFWTYDAQARAEAEAEARAEAEAEARAEAEAEAEAEARVGVELASHGSYSTCAVKRRVPRFHAPSLLLSRMLGLARFMRRGSPALAPSA